MPDKCKCELCKLSGVLDEIAKKCTPSEREALNVLWERMEGAETDLAYIECRAREGLPFSLGKDRWLALPVAKTTVS